MATHPHRPKPPSHCPAWIDLEKPIREERVSERRQKATVVHVYRCPVCTSEKRVSARLVNGEPVSSKGSIQCGADLAGPVDPTVMLGGHPKVTDHEFTPRPRRLPHV